MIWNSPTLMTLFDLLVIATGLYFYIKIYVHAKRGGAVLQSPPLVLALFGVSLFFAFFSADFLSMWVMPAIIGENAAMVLMERLHLELSWLIFPAAAITIILAILSLISRADFNHKLSASSNREGVEVAAIVRDVSLRNQASREKEELLHSLEDKNAELERYTYTVSHDLKSPLVTICGFIELLKKDIATNNQARIESDINRISDAAETMQTMLNELLELARRGRSRSTPIALSVASLVEAALKSLATTVHATQAKVSVASGLPDIHGEEPRFKEVYLNLIENAIKYRRNGVTPEISIGARNDKNNDNRVVYYVQDNGIGIDTLYHNRIFDLFERLDNASEGSGVGLAIVKRIIEVHNGEIWVESEGLGKGSRFNFALPNYNSSNDKREYTRG